VKVYVFKPPKVIGSLLKVVVGAFSRGK